MKLFHVIWQSAGREDQVVSTHRSAEAAEKIRARKQRQFMRRWQSWHSRPLARFTTDCVED